MSEFANAKVLKGKASVSGLIFQGALQTHFVRKDHLEEVAAFIREHRSNESNFETLHKKLEEELQAAGSEAYGRALAEAKEKPADEYRQAKTTGGTAWPEFEKFVAAFEKAVLEAIKTGG